MKSVKRVSGEFALMTGLLTDALGVSFILKADLGLSPIVSVQYILSEVFNFVSYGTWSYITQFIALLVLTIVIRRVESSYLFSLVMAVGFGYLIDFFNFLIKDFPVAILYRIIYFASGFFIVALGIALFMVCRMPLLPVELMIRGITKYKRIELRVFKTSMDIGCVLFTGIVSLIAFKSLKGIGIGTIISGFLLGSVTQVIRDLLLRYFSFEKIVDKKKKKKGNDYELL